MLILFYKTPNGLGQGFLNYYLLPHSLAHQLAFFSQALVSVPKSEELRQVMTTDRAFQ